MDLFSWPLLISIITLVVVTRCFFRSLKDDQNDQRINTKAHSLSTLETSVRKLLDEMTHD